MQRRQLLRAGTILLGSSAFGSETLPASAQPSAPAAFPLDRVCLFTDHLDDSGYTFGEVAGMLKQLGVSGPDLTVRAGGLVLPERAVEDLPTAVAAFRNAGLSVPMISTGITAVDPTAKTLLATAGKLGVRYFKLGYYHYEDPARWKERIESVRRELTPLVRLAQECGMVAGVHNHAGATIGGAIWDTAELLKPLEARWIGYYFDPSHATIEGGNHAWKLNFQRAAERLKMVALKDFVWEKSGGQWRTRWVPLGEGVVRWPEFLRMLAGVKFAGPLSLHIEYDPGGTTRAARFENCFNAASRDLEFLRKQWRAALTPTG